jgi:hypothetical protein
VVKVPDTLGNVEKLYTAVMVTGTGVEADADGAEPIVKKAIAHSAIAAEMNLLFRIINILFNFPFVCCFGLLWLLVEKSVLAVH